MEEAPRFRALKSDCAKSRQYKFILLPQAGRE